MFEAFINMEDWQPGTELEPREAPDYYMPTKDFKNMVRTLWYTLKHGSENQTEIEMEKYKEIMRNRIKGKLESKWFFTSKEGFLSEI